MLSKLAENKIAAPIAVFIIVTVLVYFGGFAGLPSRVESAERKVEGIDTRVHAIEKNGARDEAKLEGITKQLDRIEKLVERRR